MLSRIFFFGRNGEISSGCVVQLTVRCLSVKELSWCAPSFSPNKSNSDKSSKEMKPAQEKKLDPIHRFGVVAAMARNRVIGVGGKLPWNLPGDRKMFKLLTKDKILIIGRKTFNEDPQQSHVSHSANCIIISKSLPDEFETDRLKLARSFPEALNVARHLSEGGDFDLSNGNISCWIAGGESLYHESLLHPSCMTLCLTVLNTDIAVTTADGQPALDLARFPANYRWDNKFKEVSKSNHQDADLSYTTYTFERLKGKR
jgi:dihydrofolate reductase